MKDRDSEGLDEAQGVGDGGIEVFGDLLSAGFVLGEDFVAWGRFLAVHGQGDVGGVFFFEDLQQGEEETVDGGGIEAGGSPDRPGDEGEVRPVEQGHGIEQVQSFRHGF